MITFQTDRILAILSSTGSSEKRLTLTSWNKNPAKLDLRIWRTDEGDPKPGKGVTLTNEEAKTLYEALTKYFS